MKRCLAIAAALALCLSPLSACAPAQQDTGTAQAAAAEQQAAAAAPQGGGSAAEKGTAQATEGAGSVKSADAKANDAKSTGTKTSSSKAKKSAGKRDEAADYSRGTHRATMKIKGYGTVRIEVQSDFAPVTAEEFCRLVDKKYYDGKTLYWFLTDIYALLGSGSDDDKAVYQVRGEFEEAGFDNRLSLKRGTIAMSRTDDGRSSDASSLILFLSDCSYLDGKYAAFAKVTSGMDVFDEIDAKVNSDSKKTRIDVSENGQILDDEDCPVIKSIRMVN